MRTAASVGEALAAGAIFTVPAFVMVNVGGERLWTTFDYWEISLILLVGGILGILFIILLRRTLAVDAGLPFLESRACSEIVKTGQKGDTGARYVFGAMGLGMLIQIFKDPAGIRLFQESVQFVKELPTSIVHHMDSSRHPLGDVVHEGGHQLRRRRPRLAGARAARPLPEPPALRAAPGGRHARPAAAHRDRRLGLVQPDPADRGGRDARRRRADDVGDEVLDRRGLPRGVPPGGRHPAAPDGDGPAGARHPGRDRGPRRAGLPHPPPLQPEPRRRGRGRRRDDGDGLPVLGRGRLPGRPRGRLQPARLRPGAFHADRGRPPHGRPRRDRARRRRGSSPASRSPASCWPPWC
jgi:hypothetical protein